MPVARRWTFELDAEFGHRNISAEVEALVKEAGIETGSVTVHLTGSTGAIMGTSISVPVIDGELQLGTWQEILLINLDNRERTREVVAVAVGE
jgi:thiamine phosphate synthase YjbQ (UPF0047 family)